MLVNLRYFASIREAIGTPGESYETATTDLAGLRNELIARGAPYAQALARGRAVRMALDQALCEESAPLHATAEVAFFPPVTGG